ncbi:hypothetical protein [Mycolicibacterium goodii]|uniref:Lipocalin family protein n=1 Tax=Mycolicibacterium goodii TaxID=134601 RepID=A0ABS6HLG0_MYCGD|nr:hypothetical protein [Mycolicibacterium goodii]MBU8818820.1 hypothetical protein [Mycolicibacterium goodii]MBU8823476.1 hypothetical protein [Mycolicibacterium goodii]MBU8835475.1 hypothetical protein [Mycolicibacterium goodii]
MTRVAAWVGAGAFTAGLSAAMLAGAGYANADDDSGPKQDSTPSATQKNPDKPQRGPRAVKQRERAEASDTADTKAEVKDKVKDRVKDKAKVKAEPPAAATEGEPADATTDKEKVRTTGRDSAQNPRDVVREFRETARKASQEAVEAARNAIEDTTREVSELAARDVTKAPQLGVRPEPTEKPVKAVLRRPAVEEPDAEKNPPSVEVTPSATTQEVTPSATTMPAGKKAQPADPVEAIHDVLRSLGALALNPEPRDYPEPLSLLGDVVFDTLATLERLVGGDPVVPLALRDSVQVSTSTLVVSEGHEVESNWYLPTNAETQPTRLIYLQHGFLANGPLYSYTVSYLAAQTNSVVVTTTYTSNPFEADGVWLGGNNLHEAVAGLFLDPDRAALNTSLDAAEANAGRTTDIDVPTQFVLVGHSLGGGFAPGVAGYYAEGLTRRRDQGLDAPNELAGVVIYDAVPMGSIVPNAMGRLHTLETNGTADPGDDNPDDYIPIYEIGAPLNYLNVFSDVNDQLTEARPGQFTGVVLEDGVHMDPMLGGNPLIQFTAYLIAGFPQPQNPLAVRELSAGWINDMFDENIDPATGACKTGVACAGQYGDGDDSFTITTARGDAVAVLIGTQRARDLTSLHAISVIDFVTALPANVLNGVRTTCELFSVCPVESEEESGRETRLEIAHLAVPNEESRPWAQFQKLSYQTRTQSTSMSAG